MLKKRSLWVGFVVSLILILVNIVPTMAQGQTDDGFLYSSLSLFSPTALTYDRSRFGFQVTYGGGDPNLYDVESLGAGWYWDKEARGASDIPSHDYVQTIRLSPVLSGSTQISYTTTPSGTALIDAIAAQSGSTWFIGHQPDCHTEDNLLSEFYAYAYHDLYHLIKDVDPTAKIAAGNIVQPTEQRLMYLGRVLETYEQTYGEPLPADLWATGNMILCEKCYPYKPPGEPFAWGACWVPDWPSYSASYDIATFYSVYDHWDVDIYASRIITFRQWMHDNGYQNHPLVISEYGILFYEGLVGGQTIQDDIDFMWETFDWMRSVRDPSVGYAADDGLLTQLWAWSSLDHGAYPGGTLFDPETYQATDLGIAYADYTSLLANCDQPVTGVSVSGPISGDVGTELLFTADITPSNVTTPITYSWSSDGFIHSGGTGMIPTEYAYYRWDSPGVKTITVTVRNCGRQDFSYTHSITISGSISTCETPLTGVSLTGPATGHLDEILTFTADPQPDDATLPITYTWSSYGLLDGQGTDQATYRWAISGNKNVQITARNCGGQDVSDTHTILTYESTSDLNIDKSIEPTTDISLGEIITYTIILFNNSDSLATSVVMTDPLPSGLEFNSWVEYPAYGSFIYPGPDVTWGPRDLAAGESILFQFTAIVTDNVTYNGATIINRAYVSSDNAGSGSDTATFTIGAASPGDAYEPDDACEQAKLISTDGTVQARTFHTTDDEDWVTFEAISGTEYIVEGITPPDSVTDLILELYDSCASAPGNGQDNSFSPDIRLRFTAPQDGPLYLRVRNSEGAPAGSQATYQLSVRALDATGTPGAVVIVAGKLRDNDDVQSNIHHVTNAVYQLFLDHGYDDDRLQYLATEDLDVDGDGTQDVDAVANRANLEHAITQWALSLVSEDRAFTLYLMDHGGYDKFYLNGSTETVTPSEIAGWLDTLEQAVPGLKVNVILDACKSGSFIDLTQSLSGPGRVVIASTGARRLAWATQDGAIFSDHFIAALDRGLSLYSSFETAKWAVEAAKPAQTPWLDDNGNGLHNEADDGAVAAVRGFAYAGTFGEGDDEWPPYVVGMGLGEIVEGRGVITAEVRDNGATAPHVWAEVYPPTYTVPSLAAGEEMIVDTTPTVTLIHQGDDLYRVEYDGFSASGDDRVVVYARDENGLLGRPKAVGDFPHQGRIYLPLVLRNYATPATFPVFIESAIPPHPVNAQGEVFHTTEVRIPDTLPDGGRFYFSSERDTLTEVFVDDKLIIQVNGVEVHTNIFDYVGGIQPEIVELSRTTMERIQGKVVTVLYQDVGAGVVAASEMWLIWVPTP